MGPSPCPNDAPPAARSAPPEKFNILLHTFQYEYRKQRSDVGVIMAV